MKLILLLIISSISLILAAQKPSLQLSASSKTIEVGKAISFTVNSSINGTIDIEFPSCFLSRGTMNSMQQTIDSRGNLISSISYTQEGSFKKEGKFTLSATLKNGSKTYKSNSITVTITKKVENQKPKKSLGNSEWDISNYNLKEPIFGIIQKSSQKVYQGEPLVIGAKVFSQININMMENYTPFSLKGNTETFEIEKTDNLTLNRENLNKNSYLTFVCGKQLVFPTTTGKIIIKPFSMVLQYSDGGFFNDNTSIESNASFVEIMPLPKGAPRDFNGSVGKYTLKTYLSDNKASINDIVTYTVEISGTGNLHALPTPRIQLPSALETYGDPELKEDLSYSENGVSGTKKFIFHLKIKKSGTQFIPAFTMSYFEPEQKKYISLKDPKIEIKIDESLKKPSDQATINSLSNSIGEEDILSIPKNEKARKSEKIYPSNYLIYILICIIIALILILVLITQKKSILKNKTANTNPPLNNPSEYAHEKNIKTSFIEDQLNQAQNQAKASNYKESYSHLEHILITSINKRLGLESQIRGRNELMKLMNNSEFSEQECIDYTLLLDRCEEAKYSIDDFSEVWEESFEKVKALLI